ncbi:MAG: serine/threonine-protein kinase [Planctomycetota bacterium]
MDTSDGHSVPGTFGAFFVEEVIWRGATSTVYRARDTRDEALVALKVLYPRANCSLEKQCRNAKLEASRLRAIAHPNIIELRKHGEHEGVPYLSFPYIRGQGLDQLLQDYRPSMPALLAVLVKVGRALHYAHTQGVVHRDLKPRNILLDQHGEPRILDWGLSWSKGQASKSGFQNIVGTPAYMSPEQARGEEQNLNPATDIYSFGAILYHLVAGRPPFEADNSWKTLQMTMGLAPRPPSGLDKTVDPRMERIILACLEKEPGKRYPTAKALADDLERFLHGDKPQGPVRRLVQIFEE